MLYLISVLNRDLYLSPIEKVSDGFAKIKEEFGNRLDTHMQFCGLDGEITMKGFMMYEGYFQYKIIDTDSDYVLVSCINGKINVYPYDSYKEAWLHMRNELLNANNGEFKKRYGDNADENGYVDSTERNVNYEFHIDDMYAYADCMYGDYACDWEIFETKK